MTLVVLPIPDSCWFYWSPDVSDFSLSLFNTSTNQSDNHTQTEKENTDMIVMTTPDVNGRQICVDTIHIISHLESKDLCRPQSRTHRVPHTRLYMWLSMTVTCSDRYRRHSRLFDPIAAVRVKCIYMCVHDPILHIVMCVWLIWFTFWRYCYCRSSPMRYFDHQHI